MPLLAIVGNPPWTPESVLSESKNAAGVTSPWGWFRISRPGKRSAVGAHARKFQLSLADSRISLPLMSAADLAEFLNAILTIAQASGLMLPELMDHLSMLSSGMAAQRGIRVSLLEVARAVMANGGQITRQNPAVIRATSGQPITEASYPGLFQDSDGDQIHDADDPEPLVPGLDSVEEVRLADEMRELVHLRGRYEGMRQRLVERLHGFMPRAEIKSRTKTPYSIVNKLRRKRLEGPKGITDLVGAMLVVEDQAEMDHVVAQILGGALGPVLEHEDLYAAPKDGYRAHHFVLLVENMPAELQLKTKRMKKVAAAAHHAYKTGKLDARAMRELTDMVAKADAGDQEAAETVDFYLSDHDQLESLMTRRSNPRGLPSGWRDPLPSERSDRVHEAQLLAIGYEQKKAQQKIGRKHKFAGLSDVVNLYTGEHRSVPLGVEIGDALQSLGGDEPFEVAGFVRSGPWVARAERPRRRASNPGKKGSGQVGNFWYQLLDTVHHALHALSDQQPGRGFAVITKSQWLNLFPRIKPAGGKVDRKAAIKAWERFRERIREEDAGGAGIEVLPSSADRLGVSVVNAFDAAWRAMPGKHHQLGEGRELELRAGDLRSVKRLPPGLARAQARRGAQRGMESSRAYYEALDRSDDSADTMIPGGSEEAYEAIKARVAAEGQLEDGRVRRRAAGARKNKGGRPKEPRGKAPKTQRISLEEAKKLPGFKESLKNYRAFHDADPESVDLYYLPDGRDEETWDPVHAALHYTIETPYVVPWESNKQGSLWMHEHPEGGEPLEVVHPFTDTTMKILRGSLVRGKSWWYSN